jgi:ribose transport system substrate-binding protein
MSIVFKGSGAQRSIVAGAAAALLMGGLVACSSSGKSDDGGSGSTASTGGATTSSSAAPSSAAGGDLVAKAKQVVDQYIKGTEGAPPSSGPKAAAGKSVWVISCGQAVPGCSIQTNAAVEAAKALGWKTTLFDGAFGANDGYNKGIRQAIAAKADGIIIVSIDCVAVTQSLQEAKTAGVKVVAQSAFGCENNPSLVTQVQPNEQDKNVGEFGYTEGVAQADYLIAKTNGTAKVLNYRFVDNNFAIQINKGFTDELKKCTGCTIANADISLADYSNPSTFARKASTALLGQTDATAVHVPFDSFITGGVGQAVVQSGRADKLLVIGSEGFEANLNLIREKKGESAAMASDQTWIGYAGADTLNRVFAGQGPAAEGIGFKLIDADNNLPASGDYHSSVDFKAAYKSVWGV